MTHDTEVTTMNEQNERFIVTPLEWDGPEDDTGIFKTAPTPFGHYTIEHGPDRYGYHWGYCFDEYYDEGKFRADSFDAAKEAAGEHWLERIKGALTPV